MNHQIDTDMFKPAFPWQTDAWERITTAFPKCAHALLFSGPAGTGKSLFAQRLTAWILCHDRQSEAACGVCSSCQWLIAQTHPQLLKIGVNEDSKSNTIKVDDIREILPFSQQSSSGARVVLIDAAHLMNVSAANALLKTLEEPPPNVYFLLISDNPQLLMPTIKSRVQKINVAMVSLEAASEYLTDQGVDTEQTPQLLAMSGGAPLVAKQLINSNWYNYRQSWLNVWQALRVGQRSAQAASQFWQKVVSIDDALQLNEAIGHDLLLLDEELPIVQQDLNYDVLSPSLSGDRVLTLLDFGLTIKQQLRQNLHPSYVMDELMLKLCYL